MILDRTTNPDTNLYVLGALVLRIIAESSFQTIDPLVLRDKMRRHTAHARTVSDEYILLALDWLFMLDLVAITPNGDIKRVS